MWMMKSWIEDGSRTDSLRTALTTPHHLPAATAAAVAVTNGATALVLGTTDSTTITATQVILQPPTSAPNTTSPVVPFTHGTSDTSKTVGQISVSYTQGSGMILTGATANKVTEAALTAYPGGVVDRIVYLSNGQYEVHNIGVNWPHHILRERRLQSHRRR